MGNQLLFLFVYAISAVVLAIMVLAMLEVWHQMFKKRDIDGIDYFEGGSKYDMAGWFDSIPGDEFYGTKKCVVADFE